MEKKHHDSASSEEDEENDTDKTKQMIEFIKVSFVLNKKTIYLNLNFMKFQIISEKKIMENKVKKDIDLDKDAEVKIVEFIKKAMNSKSPNIDLKSEIAKFIKHFIKEHEHGSDENSESQSVEQLNEFEIIKMFLFKKMETVV
jgi:hypothetical protein